MRELHLDMDGVLVDLYANEDWRIDKTLESTACFEDAAPLVDMTKFRKGLLAMKEEARQAGDVLQICINTHTPEGASEDYQRRVAQTKAVWLTVYLGLDLVDRFVCTPYGTNKAAFTDLEAESWYLIDDSAKNREEFVTWGQTWGHDMRAGSENVLKTILDAAE